MAKQITDSLNNELINFAKCKKLTIGTPSRFKGEGKERKYVLAKVGTISITYSDIRIGKKVAIVKHGKAGTIFYLLNI